MINDVWDWFKDDVLFLCLKSIPLRESLIFETILNFSIPQILTFSILQISTTSSTASWPLDVDEEEEEGEGWRHVKIQQMGKNSSGQTHYLSISGFEIYGTVTKAHHDLGVFELLKKLL